MIWNYPNSLKPGKSEYTEEFMENLTPILTGLIAEGVPFRYRPLYDGWQLIFKWSGDVAADVACHSGTYGNLEGFVESYNFPWDEGDVSMLTPDDFLKKVIKYWYKKVE